MLHRNIKSYIAMQQIFPFDEEAPWSSSVRQGLEKTRLLTGIRIKANRLFIENVEKMLIFQMNSLKTYFDIGIQIRPPRDHRSQSLQDFYKRQAEIAQTVQCKLLNDAGSWPTWCSLQDRDG